MQITITFKDDPIEAEIVANEGEDYNEVLDKLSKFTESYTPIEPLEPEPNVGSSMPGGQEADPTVISSIDDFPEGQITRALKRGIVEDSDVKELPRIIGDTATLGDSDQLKLVHGSTVILTILEDAHGLERMKTSELKQALADSGLNIDNWKNIGQVDEEDVYLTRRGSGASATTEVRPPGKDKAYELIGKMIDSL